MIERGSEKAVEGVALVYVEFVSLLVLAAVASIVSVAAEDLEGIDLAAGEVVDSVATVSVAAVVLAAVGLAALVVEDSAGVAVAGDDEN